MQREMSNTPDSLSGVLLHEEEATAQLAHNYIPLYSVCV